MNSMCKIYHKFFFSFAFETKFSTGPLHALKCIRAREGFLGWYRGNGAQMVRIFPYSGIQFLSYDIYIHVSCALLKHQFVLLVT